ncbi:MAG TPA: ABC transporter ATP-binding protein [Alphaproteobacteria bacterium]
MLRLERITKRFDNGYLALQGVDLAARPGEILGIVGGSGCGKSTLLRLMCGLVPPTHGRVWFGGVPIIGPRPEIGLVFQEPRLMPWLTVAENVQFGLHNLPRAERAARAIQALDRVGLCQFADALPRELSGGMAQRTAIARALVTRPSVLLLDEPFSALDALTRADLQSHLVDIWSDERPTMVLVTHDIDEALFLSDRIVVMRGRPGAIHAEFAIDLPRPRIRTSPQFQSWKERLLAALHAAINGEATAA